MSRGPAEPDGGVSSSEVGPGGRGIDAGEDLEQVDQQPGLDAPYGNRPADQESATIEHGRTAPVSKHDRPGDVGTAQGETPGKVAGTQF